MDILYLGYFCNEKLFDELVKTGSKSSHARQQLETKLINGIIKRKGNNTLSVVSYIPEIRNDWKQTRNGECYSGVSVKYLWCNKKKIISIITAIYQNLCYIKSWAQSENKKIVITYSVNPIHVIPALLLRKKCKYKIITLCSEISIFRRTENMSFASKISKKISKWLDNSFDGYILLSKYMNEVVNKKRKPYIIIEGIAQDDRIEKITKRDKITLLYAGGLTEDNGIRILLEGFVLLKRLDLELWICGEGPLECLVREYTEIHPNILFWGIQPNQKIREMEHQVSLLMAPRFSYNEFTKYSFPSKIIEYMSSGTPTVLTRLQGIPEEYFTYVYILENETAMGIKYLIEKILSDSDKERHRIGQTAKEFVLTKKNEKVQAEKIIKFIDENF